MAGAAACRSACRSVGWAGWGRAAIIELRIGSAGRARRQRAYAIAERSDGDVVVTIHRLEDDDGLEQALAETASFPT